MPGAEATLRRVADEGIVLVSTGGADLTRPRGSATKVDGGYLVSGRKIFCSQAPVGTVMSTMFPFDDPGDGQIVLNMAVPLAAEGVTVLDTWDGHGMRGTGSHDIELQDVFVPEDKIMARRPFGKVDPPLQVIISVAMPADLRGVPRCGRGGARPRRRRSWPARPVRRTRSCSAPSASWTRSCASPRWALDGAFAIVGDDPLPSMDTVVAVMAAKREIAIAGAEVCDLALEVGGGAAFYRTKPIEQCVRDVRGARYHPFTPEESVVHAGKVALGLPADDR